MYIGGLALANCFASALSRWPRNITSDLCSQARKKLGALTSTSSTSSWCMVLLLFLLYWILSDKGDYAFSTKKSTPGSSNCTLSLALSSHRTAAIAFCANSWDQENLRDTSFQRLGLHQQDPGSNGGQWQRTMEVQVVYASQQDGSTEMRQVRHFVAQVHRSHLCSWRSTRLRRGVDALPSAEQSKKCKPSLFCFGRPTTWKEPQGQENASEEE